MNPAPPRTKPLGRVATPLVALVLVAFCYGMARYPSLPATERAKLAARFKFEKLPLPEVANHPPYKYVHEVHPSLKRIAAWISSLGASAALADLDGDGLPNDVCYVDPRTDLVTIAPVPGTGDRYAPFALSPGPLPYDPKTTAAMGVLAGDFNEDGLMDVLVYFWGRTPILYLRRASTTPLGSPVALSAADYVPTELTDSGERWFSNGAVQADLDGDGHVDLIIGNYFQDGARILDANAGGVEVLHEGKAKALNGGKKHVFLWTGAKAGANPSVAFQEVAGVFDTEVEHGWTLAIGAADLDCDLLPEIYFSHDFGPDRLMHNRSTPGHLKFGVLQGQRRFTDPKSCVLGCDSFKGMGVDFGDVNGDGFLDIYVSNIATKFGLTESHFLWQSTGKLEDMKKGIAPYVQASEKLGLSRSGWGWDCRLADFDNDGVLEAVQAVGFIRGKINRWVEQKTQERIKDILPRGSVDSLTRLVLANAIYFKGTWAVPFRAGETRPLPFHLSASSEAQAPLMHHTDNVRYMEDNDMQAVELPYSGNGLSMAVLLPRRIDGCGDLESRLTPALLPRALAQMKQQRVEIYLPKFKLDYSAGLNEPLAKMGMSDAFGPKADFSGMDGTKLLYISGVFHKAWVEVNEEGTEAAAATVVGMAPSAVMRPLAPPPVFRADHPFIFLIRDTRSGSLLFLGRLAQPSA